MDANHQMSIKMKDRIKIRKLKNSIFHGFILLITCFGIFVLFILFLDVIKKGSKWINWEFITNSASSIAADSGILPAMLGSLYLIILTVIISVPVGISSAIYLEEYAKDNRLTRFIKVNISNLSGTPSIVYGLLGLTVFVGVMGLGRSLIAGALTMSLVILPIVIVASQEAIKSVPQFLRHGSYALGATKWQTIRKIVLPTAFPGILTGIILSISRAMGESAPILMAGAFAYVNFAPESIMDKFTALPIQIYAWTSKPQATFREIAAAGIIVLLAVLVLTNATAIILRNKYQKNVD